LKEFLSLNLQKVQVQQQALMPLQFQVAQLPERLEICISVFPEFDPEVTRMKTEETIRAILEKLDTESVRVNVRVVDGIERVGTGVKEKLVTKPDRG
jgi:hypothetical protein